MGQTSTLVGPVATEALVKMAFNRAFIGTTGVTLKHGYSNSNMHESEVKRLAIQQASEVNIGMDHSQFGRQDLFSFGGLKAADRVITDQYPEQELDEAFKEQSVEIFASIWSSTEKPSTLQQQELTASLC